MDAISAARSGLVTAIRNFEGASADLANAFSGEGNAAASAALVNDAKARTAFRASLATLSTTRKTTQALLDIKV